MYKIYIKKNTTSKELLAASLLDFAGIKNPNIIYNEYGKPSLKSNECFFNISNTKDTSVCVVSNKEIGVDIESITYKEKVMKKVCNNQELDIIKNSKNKEYEFTKIWVMKESYVKMLGIGLSYGLENVDTTSLEEEFDLLEYEDCLIAVIERQ